MNIYQIAKKITCNYLPMVFFLIFPFNLFAYSSQFIHNENTLEPYYGCHNVIMITSTGRSGSTLLSDCVKQSAVDFRILKSHLLPPKNQFIGKILFIFSNPDIAAESSLHLTINDKEWGDLHFHYVKSSDTQWLTKIGGTTNQTVEDNLLSYDALGCYDHLVEWLDKTKPSKPHEAQILAIKYENLWDRETIQSVKNFLHLDNFELPAKNKRGYFGQQLDPKELNFRKIYNLGTNETPIYRAYDNARKIWERASPLTYLQLREK